MSIRVVLELPWSSLARLTLSPVDFANRELRISICTLRRPKSPQRGLIFHTKFSAAAFWTASKWTRGNRRERERERELDRFSMLLSCGYRAKIQDVRPVDLHSRKQAEDGERIMSKYALPAWWIHAGAYECLPLSLARARARVLSEIQRTPAEDRSRIDEPFHVPFATASNISIEMPWMRFDK